MTCLLLAQANPYDDWLTRALDVLIRAAHPADGSFLDSVPNLLGLLAVILVSLVCGAVGSLVVGNRMAFFSDALAHTAFAGIALGFLTALLVGAAGRDFFDWATPIMVVFGILVGLAIAYVREKTALASDTVIGVFFAGAIGFGAMLLQGIAATGTYYSAEDFLFGAVLTITPRDVELLFLLAVLTAGGLALLYNQLLFTTFNPSLARSRRIPVRLCSYLFITLLALIINLCLRTVGALLINALLIVPAATACNLCRNLRQLFWASVLLCLGVSAGGHVLAYHVNIPLRPGSAIHFGSGGTIVVLSVLLFFLSLAAGGLRQRMQKPTGQKPEAGRGEP
jgi:zinc transport system permease protein